MLFTDLNFSGHRVFSRKLHFFTEPAFLADTAFFHGSCIFSELSIFPRKLHFFADTAFTESCNAYGQTFTQIQPILKRI